MEHDLDDKISELLAEAVEIAGVDRLENLVGLFDQMTRERFVRLLTVPRAAVRCAQACHDVDEPLEGGAGRLDKASDGVRIEIVGAGFGH
jgi:hypothetical protein